MKSNNLFSRGIILAALVTCMCFPLVAHGEESKVSEKERKAEVRKDSQTDSGVTFSDVMGWAQRFGNRVGDNISEATSKTATAIKNAASDTKQETESKDSH